MKIVIKSGMLFQEQHTPAAPHSVDEPTAPHEPAVLRAIGIRHDPDQPAYSSVALIRCDKQQMPFLMALKRLEELVAIGDYVIVNEAANPAAPGIRCAEDLNERAEEFSKALAHNARLISPVLQLGWGAFDLRARARVIRDISMEKKDGAGSSKSWIRDLLWRYWSGGALAIGPQYHRCGALTRTEIYKRSQISRIVKPGRRPGRARKYIGRERSQSTYDRGGSYISPKCELTITNLLKAYFKEECNLANVRISLESRDTLPWTAVKSWVEPKLQEFPEFAHVYPSIPQVKYIAERSESIDLIKIRRWAQGSRFVSANFQSFNGDYRDVSSGAGHRYEIDAAKADIHLVDDVSGLVIGRPNIVYIVDSYSGMVTGLYVTIDDIDFTHVSRALHCAFSTKSDWCRIFGLDINDLEWPCEGRCGQLTADNAQLITKAAEAVPELVTDSGICPSYRPDRKGLVESIVHLANVGMVHFCSYGVTKGPKERAKVDTAHGAVVSMQTFTSALVSWVVNVANHRPLPINRELDQAFLATDLEPTPFNVWQWSVEVKGGPPHAYESSHWMPRLLERNKAKVTQYGLEIDGIFFDDKECADLQAMKLAASHGKVKHLPVHLDRLTTNLIYLVPDDITQAPQPIPLSHYSREWAGLTFAEAKLRKGSRRAKTDDAEMKFNRRKAAEAKRLKAAVEADLAKVKETHGSFAARKRTSDGTDLEEVAQDQSKADNAKVTDAIHGPMSPPENPTENLGPTMPKAARPDCL